MKKQILLAAILIMAIFGFGYETHAQVTCTAPEIEYQGACTVPNPPCLNPPEYSVQGKCFDKINAGQRTERYDFTCNDGFMRSGTECIRPSSYKANIVSYTNNNDTAVFVFTKMNNLYDGEYYYSECVQKLNTQEMHSGYSADTNVTVSDLKPNITYRCSSSLARLWPSGSVMSQGEFGNVVEFTTPSFATIQPSIVMQPTTSQTPTQTPATTTQNQKPSITTATYAIDTNVPEIGTKFTFTAGGQDPENDNYRMKFWVCKLDGTICNNAMNGSAEEWTYGNQFSWKAFDGGKYQLHVVIVDGHHAGTDSPFGDNQYILPFEVYGKPTITTPSTTTPASTSSNNTVHTPSSSTSGVATSNAPKAGYEDEVLTSYDSNPFSDTDVTSASGKAAAELYRRGVIGGYADGQFKGSRSVNRAEAAKFLLLARYGTVDDMSNSGKFSDVLDGQWYTKFVVKAASLGIINGYGDGSFRPGSTVSTAEFVKMLTKTFELEENLPYSYTDVESTDWFAPYAGIAQKYNLFPNHQTKLMPQTLLARDEVALAIYQYLKNR